MEKEISLYTVGTDYLSFVIVASPALNKTPVILMIYLYKLLWNSFLKLLERNPYNFIFGKPHDLLGKTLITVYVCFIQVSLEYRAWDTIKQSLQKLHIILKLTFGFP